MIVEECAVHVHLQVLFYFLLDCFLGGGGVGDDGDGSTADHRFILLFPRFYHYYTWIVN